MSATLAGPGYRDPDDEFEYWLSEKGKKVGENAPDKLLKYAELIQVLENEIRWCVDNPDPAFHAEYRKGFINGLIQAKYLVTKLAHLNQPGYMGDIGGVGCDPADRDAE